MFRIFLLATIALCSVTARAATWNAVFAGATAKNVLFFDADTVSKQGDKITIWEKNVQKPNTPESNGVYAYATKYVYSCNKRTYQALTTSTYDGSGQFIRTYPDPGREEDIVPGSIGESLLKVYCASDFPRDKSGSKYVAVKDNNVFAYTLNFFAYMDATQNDPAPK